MYLCSYYDDTYYQLLIWYSIRAPFRAGSLTDVLDFGHDDVAEELLHLATHLQDPHQGLGYLVLHVCVRV